MQIINARCCNEDANFFWHARFMGLLIKEIASQQPAFNHVNNLSFYNFLGNVQLFTQKLFNTACTWVCFKTRVQDFKFKFVVKLFHGFPFHGLMGCWKLHSTHDCGNPPLLTALCDDVNFKLPPSDRHYGAGLGYAFLSQRVQLSHAPIPAPPSFYGADSDFIFTTCSCEVVGNQQFPMSAPPLYGPDGSIRKDSKSHSHKRYNSIRPALFLTSRARDGILCLGAEYTLRSAVAIPTASGLFSCLIVFYGWGAPNRKAGGMTDLMYSTPRPPYALNKQNGGYQSRSGDLTMSKSALMPVEFHGATLSLISIEDKPYVALKPICDALSLDWSAQYRRIERNPVLKSSVAVMAMQLAGDSQQREVVCLPLSMLNGWLFGINANRVKNPVIRQKLIEYQFECYDVLHQHWSGKISYGLDHIDQTNLLCLCSHMLFLDGWWHQYGPAVRAFNRRVAASVHDDFNDGAFVALSLAHKHKLNVPSGKYVRNYPFHEDFDTKNRYHLMHGKK